MDTFTQTTETTEDTLPMLAHEREHKPFRADVAGVATLHPTYSDACTSIVNALGPVRLVMRRDFGARRIGVWVEQYNVEIEPAATITWQRGARL